MSYDKTFCAAKCVNALCDRNKIHTAQAPKAKLLSWADMSKGCVAIETPDGNFIKNRDIVYQMRKANQAQGLSWELGEAFHEIAFIVAGRITDGELTAACAHVMPDADKRGFEMLMDRLRLKKSGLPWVS